MFLELPDLPTATFPSLQELTYDGPVSQQVNPCSFHVSTGLFWSRSCGAFNLGFVPLPVRHFNTPFRSVEQ